MEHKKCVLRNQKSERWKSVRFNLSSQRRRRRDTHNKEKKKKDGERRLMIAAQRFRQRSAEKRTEKTERKREGVTDEWKVAFQVLHPNEQKQERVVSLDCLTLAGSPGFKCDARFVTSQTQTNMHTH